MIKSHLQWPKLIKPVCSTDFTFAFSKRFYWVQSINIQLHVDNSNCYLLNVYTGYWMHPITIHYTDNNYLMNVLYACTDYLGALIVYTQYTANSNPVKFHTQGQTSLWMNTLNYCWILLILFFSSCYLSYLFKKCNSFTMHLSTRSGTWKLGA